LGSKEGVEAVFETALGAGLRTGVFFALVGTDFFAMPNQVFSFWMIFL
jgi:hypothetical protein